MTTTDTTKDQWVTEYAQRILTLWQAQQPPLGIDTEYAQNIEQQLETWFENPLKKDLIEATY